eukprot:NODE_2601_length_1158_cov_443.724977_g2379_i0.p1 GENE.NODE_2601_length_1158_cov_443.724977_g2379_i0~~NODE_2601_length_1158_cov_443.724977_g2379_i0.p1  ORF type:complete len:339 (-),score=83.61 NODE_2601_length_1158_cov_443.724977_g2379_i0:88-1104(-)
MPGLRTRPPRHRAAGGNEERVYSKKKVAYREMAMSLLDQYEKIMVVTLTNVQSRQMQNIRIALRGKAAILCGKNTTIKKILLDRLTLRNTEKDQALYRELNHLMVGNVGLILTNGDLSEILQLVDSEKVQAPARAGATSPVDVIVPAGNTGLEPTKTSFFQALNINTKITKGTVEILKDEKVIVAGDRVGSSEAALLQMLNIKPFFYGLVVEKIYEEGTTYGREILELTDEDMKKKFAVGLNNVTALSLATGLTTKLSFPHVVMNAFKNLLAVSVATDYTFSEFGMAEVITAVREGRSLGGSAAAPVAAAKEAVAEAAPAAKVEEEEEDDDMGFGLFD